jgi:hypothetical protein
VQVELIAEMPGHEVWIYEGPIATGVLRRADSGSSW